MWRQHRNEVLNVAHASIQSDHSLSEDISEIEVSDANISETEVSKACASDTEMKSLGSGDEIQSSDVLVDVDNNILTDPGSVIREDLDIGSLSEEDEDVDHPLSKQLKNWALRNKCTRQYFVNLILMSQRIVELCCPPKEILIKYLLG